MLIRISLYCIIILAFLRTDKAFSQYSQIDSKQLSGSLLIMGENDLYFTDTEENIQERPRIASDMNGNYVIVWCDTRNGNRDIYAQMFSSMDSAIGSNFKVNDDSGEVPQYDPSIAMNNQGDFVIAWLDSRDSIRWPNGHIYCKRFSSNGIPIETDFKVDDDNSRIGGTWFSSSIAMNDNGNFVVAWQDMREHTGPDIYAQCFSPNGSIIGVNFRATGEDTVFHWNSVPAVAMDKNDNFVITWAVEGEAIMARRFGKDGTPIGYKFEVNDSNGSLSPFAADIAMTDEGKFIIVWVYEQQNVYGQLFNEEGLKVGQNFQVSNYQSDYEVFFSEPSVAMRNNGDFIVTWSDNRIFYFDIYFQRFLADGTPQDTNIIVNTNRLHDQQFSSITTSDNLEDFVITWEDNLNTFNSEVAVQRFSKDGTAIGNNFKINDVTVDVDYKHTPLEASNFILYYNYPNPFNPATKISWQSPVSSWQTLKIYDVLGKEIATLVNEVKEPGYYEIQFDGGKLPSGVYFYKLQCGNYTEVKKMILAK